MTQKSRTIVMVAMVTLAMVIVFLWNRRERVQQAGPDPTTTDRGSATASGSAAPPASPTSETFRRIDKPARAALLERMRAARARGSASTSSVSSTTPPTLPLPGRLERADVQKGVRDLIPLLAECYDAALPRLTKKAGGITVHMVFTGEPEIGTLIQAAEIAGDDHLAKDAGLVECLQQTMLSIELPPMAESGEVTVTYPIEFSP